MFNLISIIFKYIFIIIIYFFIYSILRLIYLDIRGLSFVTSDDSTYLKLLTDMESLPFLIKEYYILNRELSLGRSLNNDIIIENPYVSKRHTIIKKVDGKDIIQDLSSSNGTYLNGKKVLGSTELKNGDEIEVGNVEFKFINR